jgi:hypothetical protein
MRVGACSPLSDEDDKTFDDVEYPKTAFKKKSFFRKAARLFWASKESIFIGSRSSKELDDDEDVATVFILARRPVEMLVFLGTEEAVESLDTVRKTLVSFIPLLTGRRTLVSLIIFLTGVFFLLGSMELVASRIA